MQVIGYVRVSKDSQTMENQTRLLKEKGASRLFGDEGVSGMRKAKERFGFTQMLNYISTNPDPEGYIVWVFELSRIGRGMLDTLSTIVELEDQNVRIYSISDGWTLQPDAHIRKLMMAIVLWCAEQEMITIKKRIGAGLARAKAEGKILGFKPKNIDWEFVEQKRKEGLTYRKIADALNIHEVTLLRRRKKQMNVRLNSDSDGKIT